MVMESKGGKPPKSVRDKLKDADNVTGGEFTPPTDLNGYYDEPQMKFGLWVGESEDDAELLTFELNGEQIQGFADVFTQAANDAEDLGNE